MTKRLVQGADSVPLCNVILMGFCCLVMSGLGLVAGSGSSLFSAAGVVV